MSNFKYIGVCDVSSTKIRLQEIGESIWLEHTIRQTVFGAHKHTETIELMWDLESLSDIRPGKIHSNFYKFNIEEFLNEVKPLYKEKYGEGKFLRVLLVKLKKQSSIYPHKDNGDTLALCKRTHIPVITNELVSFKIDDEIKYLKEGEIWEINNQNLHSVENTSNEDRIHFIIDYLTEVKKTLI